ncbi:unnamed protein product [Linum trigynum]|uniref:Uncharacterized protein n=1 Tax=Linum trigynum TaxID=586398 RepID=A0AAV2FTH6_9ROSI
MVDSYNTTKVQSHRRIFGFHSSTASSFSSGSSFAFKSLLRDRVRSSHPLDKPRFVGISHLLSRRSGEEGDREWAGIAKPRTTQNNRKWKPHRTIRRRGEEDYVIRFCDKGFGKGLVR